MSNINISIIGTGNMARAIGALAAVAGGNTVEVIGRDQSKAADLAKTLGGSTTTGEFGAVPAGDIVIVALLYANVVPVVAQYGNALAGKVIVDISNPFNSAADGLAIPDDTSIAQEVAKAAPAGASVVKAFNTIFGVVLAKGRPLDVFIAGDDARAKAGVAEFIESLGLRPLDVGGLNMAHWLEGTGLVVMGLASHGVGNYDFALGASRSRLSRTAAGPSRKRTGAPCAQIMVDGSLKRFERSLAMKLGFAIPIVGSAVSSAAGLSAFCRGLEDLGYDTLWVGDRLVTPVDMHSTYPGKEQPYPPQMTRYLDPVLLWTVAATATSRVRLNASTLSTFYYEPVHLARLLTTLDVLSDGRLDVGVGIGWMKDEHDIARGADWRRRGQMLDDLLAFLHEWWTTTPVSWDSEFFSLPPVHADLRPVQAGGPPIWIGGASEAAMRRVGRSGTGWLGVEGLQDEVTDHLWSIARRAAQDAGRDPDALKTAMRINLEPGTSVDSVAGKLERLAGSGADEAIVDAFAMFPTLDQLLDFASQVIDRWSNRGKA